VKFIHSTREFSNEYGTTELTTFDLIDEKGDEIGLISFGTQSTFAKQNLVLAEVNYVDIKV
jgi:hypothetical protein